MIRLVTRDSLVAFVALFLVLLAGTLELAAQQHERLFLQLRPRTAGAEVFFDGAPVGVSSSSGKVLLRKPKVGVHSLRVEKNGAMLLDGIIEIPSAAALKGIDVLPVALSASRVDAARRSEHQVHSFSNGSRREPLGGFNEARFAQTKFVRLSNYKV